MTLARSTPPEPYGSVLRRLRSQARLTQEELAERSRLSVRSIQEMEGGRVSRPHRESVRLLAEALNVSGSVRSELFAAAEAGLSGDIRSATRAVAGGAPISPLTAPDGGGMVAAGMVLTESDPGADGFLVIRSRGGTNVQPLSGARLTVGASESNGLVLRDDPTVSRVHAVLQRYPAGWSVRDLGSRNGTFVNARQTSIEQFLRPGDELRIGTVRLVYQNSEPETPDTVDADLQQPPQLTRRERDVLVELCLPVLNGLPFTLPSDDCDIACALQIGEAGVRHHLRNLYDKFRIHAENGDSHQRRVQLANEALARGVVSIAQLRMVARRR